MNMAFVIHRGGSGRERFDNGERHDDRRYAGNGDRRSRSPRRGMHACVLDVERYLR